ncbi:alpha/beta fold hydrolase [Pokkaliibacter sp. CJK22405]|uniref:alpha/beta fold hydrolase n=1 Tax=Pokkaliibacter sp. CJK22405 TaxID=3384615 RepID=UPI003984DEA2
MSKRTWVLINGWSMPDCLWQPIQEANPNPVISLTLPDVASFEECVDLLLAQAPADSLWLGWSLGGRLAMAAAAREASQVDAHKVSERKVAGVLTMAATPTFVANQSTLGLSAETLQHFIHGMSAQPELTLRQFQRLVVKGADDRATTLKAIAGEPLPYSFDLLSQQLHWLAPDHEALWQQAAAYCPCLHLAGGKDALVPVSRYQQEFVGMGQVAIHEAAGHVLHWPDAAVLLAGCQLLEASVE